MSNFLISVLKLIGKIFLGIISSMLIVNSFNSYNSFSAEILFSCGFLIAVGAFYL